MICLISPLIAVFFSFVVTSGLRMYLLGLWTQPFSIAKWQPSSHVGFLDYLVGGFSPTPLKNMSQLGWWNSQLNGNWMESHKIPWFQSPPTSYLLVILIDPCAGPYVGVSRAWATPNHGEGWTWYPSSTARKKMSLRQKQKPNGTWGPRNYPRQALRNFAIAWSIDCC